MMDDLISRAAAISWFFRPYSNEESYSNFDVERVLKAVPAVDAVPVEWMREKIDGYASRLRSRELDALVTVLTMWKKEQEAR